MPGPGGHHGGGPGGPHGGGRPGGFHGGGGPGGPHGGHHGGPYGRGPRPHMGGWGMWNRPPRRRGCSGCLFPVIGVVAVSVFALLFLLF